MIKAFRFIPLAFGALILISCGGGTTSKGAVVSDSDTSFFFSGGFVYFADAALLNDCATGVAIPVSNINAYIEAERQYLALGPTDAEPIFVSFVGHIVREQSEEIEGLPYSVAIDSLIGFDRSSACDPEVLIPGFYECETAREKVNITLGGDYKFVQRRFNTNAESGDSVYSGEWAKSLSGKIVLIYSTLNGQKYDRRITMLFDPASEMLIEEIGGEQLIYKRVYL